MSTGISSLAIVFLLCFSHACNARSFGVVHKKIDQNINPGSLSIQPDSVQDGPGELITTAERSFDKTKVTNGKYNEPGNGFQAKGDRVKDSNARKKWRVPHRKRGDQEPGFNQDYSPPKTHPPVHN